MGIQNGIPEGKKPVGFEEHYKNILTTILTNYKDNIDQYDKFVESINPFLLSDVNTYKHTLCSIKLINNKEYIDVDNTVYTSKLMKNDNDLCFITIINPYHSQPGIINSEYITIITIGRTGKRKLHVLSIKDLKSVSVIDTPDVDNIDEEKESTVVLEFTGLNKTLIINRQEHVPNSEEYIAGYDAFVNMILYLFYHGGVPVCL